MKSLIYALLLASCSYAPSHFEDVNTYVNNSIEYAPYSPSPWAVQFSGIGNCTNYAATKKYILNNEGYKADIYVCEANYISRGSLNAYRAQHAFVISGNWVLDNMYNFVYPVSSLNCTENTLKRKD